MRGDKPKGWTPLLEEEFQAATKPAGWTQADEEAFQAQFGPSAGQYALQGLESVGQGIAQAIGDVAALPGEVARLAGVPAQVAGMVPGVGDLQDLSQGAQAVQGAIPNVTAVQAAPDSAAKFLATSGASAVGQVLPTLGTMGVGKAAGLGSRALAGLGAGVGAAQGAVQGSQEAAAAGASKPEQWGAFLVNGGLGVLDTIVPSHVLARMDDATGGGLKKAALGMLAETGQGAWTNAVQQYGADLYAQGTYEPTRDLSIGEAAAGGGFAGAFLSALASGARAAKARGIVPSRAVNLPTQESTTFESSVNGANVDSENAAYAEVGDAAKVHGVSGPDVPSDPIVVARMFGMVQDRKVADSIIESIPIDVMDVLRAKQISPEKLLHDESVFRNLFSIKEHESVSVPDISSAAMRVVARHIAERTVGRGQSGLESGDVSTASSTLDNQHGIAPKGDVVSGAAGSEVPAGPASIPLPAASPAPDAGSRGERAPGEAPFAEGEEPIKPKPPPKGRDPVETAPHFGPDREATGVKNRTVDAELKSMGLDAAEHDGPLKDKDVAKRATDAFNADNLAGKRLADELADSDRTATADEIGLLTLETARRKAEHRAASEAYIADPSAENRKRLDEAGADYATLADTVTKLGTRQAQAFRLRQMMMRADYSLAELERRAVEANAGEPITDAERAELKKSADEIARLQKEAENAKKARVREERIAALEEAVAELSKSRQRATRVRARELRRSQARERIDRGLARLAELGRAARSNIPDPEAFKVAGEIALDHLRIGLYKFQDFADAITKHFGDGLNAHLPKVWEDARSTFKGEIADPLAKRLKAGATLMELRRYVTKIADTFHQEGITDRDKLVDAVHDVLKQADPKITREQTMDAISGYGDFQPLDPSEERRAMRDIKGELRQLAKLRELEKGLPPKKSGPERHEPSNAERRLIKQVNELRKKLGIKTTDAETQLKSALDSLKTRLRNQISDLQTEIDTGKRGSKARTPIERDAEAKALEAQRDEIQKVHDSIFAEPKKSSDEKRVDAARRILKKQIEDLELRIATGDTAAKKGQLAPSTPELDALRAEKNALAAELAEMRHANDVTITDEERAAAAGERRLARQLAKLQERNLYQDFEPRTKKPPREKSEKELETLGAIDIEKRKIERGLAEKRRRHRTKLQIALDAAKEVVDLPRAIKSSWDLSAPFRQGMFFTLGHPIKAAQFAGHMVRAAASPKYAERLAYQLKHRHLAAFAERSKLELTGDEFTKQEEAIRSVLSDKIPGIRRSNAAYQTFLNLQRAWMFDTMVQSLPSAPTIEQGRELARIVNIATGRGDVGKFASTVKGASYVLWAPRLLISRFQLVLEPARQAYKAGVGTGDAATRKLIAKEYARTLAGLAALYGAVQFAGLWMDDEDKPTVSFDVTSSDFGKIKFGNTRIDPLAGIAQITVLMGRHADMAATVARGETPKQGSDSALGRFLRYKLAPDIAVPIELLSGRNAVGEKMTPLETLAGSVTPLAFRDIYETMQEQGVAKGTAISILSLLGMGAQTYDDKK